MRRQNESSPATTPNGRSSYKRSSRFSSRQIQTSPSTDHELERKYDLTPVNDKKAGGEVSDGLFVDPWENEKRLWEQEEATGLILPSSPASPSVYIEQTDTSEGGEDDDSFGPEERDRQHSSVFLGPHDIHPNMEDNANDIDQLRLLAGKLSTEWQPGSMAAPALLRRIRDFQFAQEKRRKKYGDEKPWGILGLYEHLSSIRIDVEWAEDQAWRRSNGLPYMSWAEFDERKTGGSNRPYFTYLLLVVCTGMLVASIAVNGWKVAPISENPMIGPSAQTLIVMGAKDTALIVNENEGWRLISCTVLHAGLVHFFINMLALWFVGGAIETNHGWIAAIIIFIISAVGGSIFSALFLPGYITVGASGGIFGFIGACLADIVMNWKLLFCDFVTEHREKQSHIMVVAILVVDILLNCIIGLTPYVDNFTHLSGLVYGFLCGMSTMERLSTDFFGLEEAWTTRAKHFVMRFFGIIMSLTTIIITLVVLLQGDGESSPCPKCLYISCVPFPPWRDDKWWYCDDCGQVTADLVQEPQLHLDLYCPAGDMASVMLSNATDVSRPTLQKKLPSYCRDFCPEMLDNGGRYF
ncbi:hypothetical protein MPSEU_000800900 [Mayamaea pseudoterrestris]|nr:hypothetical protein MPSEU_000800900 [Mayamaea pseudoterrestris]